MDLVRFDRYMTTESKQVVGWIGENLHTSVGTIAALQYKHGVTGNVCEIGVYQGRFAVGLSWLMRDGETFCAVDVFDEQWMNIDFSGTGASRAAFEDNWDKFANGNVFLSLHQADSLSMNEISKREVFEKSGPFRLFSVDGGHMAEHVINDVKIAIQYLARGGVIFVDDYLNPFWPGVHEGFCKFMFNEHPSVRPFCFHENKLFLCSHTYGESYLNEVKQRLTRVNQSKVASMFGYDVLVV